MTLNLNRSCLALAGSVIMFSLVACSSHSLGTYKGSTTDLLPEKVNSYERVKVHSEPATLGIAEATRGMNLQQAQGGGYLSNDKGLLFYVVVFDTPEKAINVLRRLKIAASSEQGASVIAAGEKIKGGSVVGERFEVTAVLPYKERETQQVDEHIYWTNGSVMFLILNAGSTKVASEELEAFEDALAY